MATRTRTRKPPASKGDDFDQGGPDGPTKQRGKGDNSGKYDGEMIAGACEDIAELEAKMQKRLDEAKKKNQADREKIKEIKADVVESGVPAKVLNTTLRKKRLERQIETIDAALSDDEKETFAEVQAAIGDYGDTPLGKAALSRASA